ATMPSAHAAFDVGREGSSVQVAFGFKAHSGWAALVGVGSAGGEWRIVDRRRIELVDEADASWAKQPYHAAEALNPDEAGAVVRRGADAARRNAVEAIQAAVERSQQANDE